MKTPAMQRAWREKIGLISIILLICGAVGFLTFGFTQTVCSGEFENLSRVKKAARGTIIANGFAYNMDVLSFRHPPLHGFKDDSNVAYPPIDAGGKDVSFLFQNVNRKCLGVITKQPGGDYFEQNGRMGWYFPCAIVPQENSGHIVNRAYVKGACHTVDASRRRFFSLRKTGEVFYDWKDVENPRRNLAVYNSKVLDFDKLRWLDEKQVRFPHLFNELKLSNNTYRRKDTTLLFLNAGLKKQADCLADIIRVGSIDTKSMGCIASDIVLWVSFIFIVGVVFIKFGLAVIFGWFLSWRLGAFKRPTYEERMKRAQEIEQWSENIYKPAPNLKKRSSFLPSSSRFSSAVSGSRSSNNHQIGPRPVSYGTYTTRRSMYLRPSPSSNTLAPPQLPTSSSRTSPKGSPHDSPVTSPTLSPESPNGSTPPESPRLSAVRKINSTSSLAPRPSLSDSKDVSTTHNLDTLDQPYSFDLIHTICVVTAYSESVEGLRTTLDSVATSDYPGSHKLLLVIADGDITGAGNKMSTPDICLSMMSELVIPKELVETHSYVAVADGTKRHNMAKVYGGFYKYDDMTVDSSKQQRVPMVLVVKCGTPEERETSNRRGNRGKRDSQIILMGFLQRVMFDERMTPLEYEFFNAIWKVAGVTPDKYEIVMMVDADTKIYPDSLTRMVACMANDHDIMGLCGETKIANKMDSLWTMIQVFEYYISHHLSKAFESIFGGVTCLPGCFCMYRIKAQKGPDGYWVPILANPDIVEHYSENIVDTLHKKNLLLLGEDRFLTTLMLRTFPKRKMVFVPQAVCKTVVPDSLRVLISQRRRWINSTIHNLMELVMVRDLCGTFCFSMQFVIFMELVGTVVLPAAISFTVYLIVISFIVTPKPVIPLLLLAAILGLPALLILMTTRKIVYVFWMLIYLLSLPIWNFVLPVYAFWHFDDFTWGQTRVVAGEKGGGKDYGTKEGEFDSSKIIMKRWAEFERERRYKDAVAQGLPPPVFVDDSGAVARLSRYSAASSDTVSTTQTSESALPLTRNGEPTPGLSLTTVEGQLDLGRSSPSEISPVSSGAEINANISNDLHATPRAGDIELENLTPLTQPAVTDEERVDEDNAAIGENMTTAAQLHAQHRIRQSISSSPQPPTPAHSSGSRRHSRYGEFYAQAPPNQRSSVRRDGVPRQGSRESLQSQGSGSGRVLRQASRDTAGYNHPNARQGSRDSLNGPPRPAFARERRGSRESLASDTSAAHRYYNAGANRNSTRSPTGSMGMADPRRRG